MAEARCKLKADVAEMRRLVAEALEHNVQEPFKREWDRLKQRQEREYGKSGGYIFGLSGAHNLTQQQWQELCFSYKALAMVSSNVARDGAPVTTAARAKYEATLKRFEKASEPCGADLDHDIDADWLASLLAPEVEDVPPVVAVNADLATWDSFRTLAAQPAIYQRRSAPVPQRTQPSDRVRLKAEVAFVKAEIGRLEAIGMDSTSCHNELHRLRARHDDAGRDGYVYGFAQKHALDTDGWRRLGDAYKDLADAMITGVASPADARRGMVAIQRLREAMIPAGADLNHDDDADDLMAEIAERHPRLRLESDTEPIEPFLTRLADLPDSEDAVADLAQMVLEAGVRPSDPRLRDALLEWVDELEDLARPELRTLVREISTERDRLNGGTELAEDVVEDMEYVRQLAMLKDMTRGKRLLIVGGLCREGSRIAIERELELAEAVWPSADEHLTKPAHFDTAVDNADIIVKTRFCRRGYQRTIARAKDQGKSVVSLTAGYNVRQVIRAMHEQWFARS